MVEVIPGTGELVGTACMAVVIAFIPLLVARGFRFVIRLMNPPGTEVQDER